MIRALRAEFVKLKGSRMPLWSALIVAASAVGSLAAFPALCDPSAAKMVDTWGPDFAEAIAAGVYEPTWRNGLRMGLHMMAGDWAILAFGLVTAYLFAAEFREGTARTVFTLPLRREWIVLAKMAVLAVWVSALGVLSVLLTMAALALLGLDGFAWEWVVENLGQTMEAVVLVYLTLPIVALLAMSFRAYLQPMVFSLAIVMAGFGVVGTSISQWLPWYMPIHIAGTTYHPLSPGPLSAGSWMVAVAVFVAGLIACMWRIDRGDVVG